MITSYTREKAYVIHNKRLWDFRSDLLGDRSQIPITKRCTCISQTLRPCFMSSVWLCVWHSVLSRMLKAFLNQLNTVCKVMTWILFFNAVQKRKLIPTWKSTSHFYFFVSLFPHAHLRRYWLEISNGHYVLKITSTFNSYISLFKCNENGSRTSPDLCSEQSTNHDIPLCVENTQWYIQIR